MTRCSSANVEHFNLVLIKNEVWACEYTGQKVEAKRLLQVKEPKAEDSSLNNLTMVIEFFPLGDLQSYLRRNADLLSWAKDKIHMAVGVARALEYLLRTRPEHPLSW
ncbi:hypothetical protein PR003_g8171 [Phytophthora rubi]|uniref:Serine-threonine/tyrosine-protein kinase catalytic domain-containing protein n=1 Tax=Phytophthora rubi TaxID=129364 RepID=A0A6A4FW41_9STRA|nr:hypothetical protein PR002_g6288 [Phytophthora rubi]KAE9345009.1 hypothetical protein PR003_g8171 [Phytophthora rubi]